MSALISFREPLIYLSALHKNARVHLFAQRVYCSAVPGRRHAEAACLPKPWRWQAKLDAVIAACLPVRQANLKELGYGG